MSHDIMVIESPLNMIEGEALTFSITWLGAASVSAQASVLYKDRSVYTATAMSGSSSASGIVQTLETITAQAGDGGKKYVVAVKATVDGNTEMRKLIINVIKDEAEV